MADPLIDAMEAKMRVRFGNWPHTDPPGTPGGSWVKPGQWAACWFPERPPDTSTRFFYTCRGCVLSSIAGIKNDYMSGTVHITNANGEGERLVSLGRISNALERALTEHMDLTRDGWLYDLVMGND